MSKSANRQSRAVFGGMGNEPDVAGPVLARLLRPALQDSPPGNAA